MVVVVLQVVVEVRRAETLLLVTFVRFHFLFFRERKNLERERERERIRDFSIFFSLGILLFY